MPSHYLHQYCLLVNWTLGNKLRWNLNKNIFVKQGKSEGFDSCNHLIFWIVIQMTLENNRAPLLCYFKLCVSLHTHWWIQTGVTVWKRPIQVKIGDFFLVWPLKTDRRMDWTIHSAAWSQLKMPLKMSSAKWQPFSLSLNVLRVARVCQSWHLVVGNFRALTYIVALLCRYENALLCQG